MGCGQKVNKSTVIPHTCTQWAFVVLIIVASFDVLLLWQSLGLQILWLPLSAWLAGTTSIDLPFIEVHVQLWASVVVVSINYVSFA